MIEHIRSKLAEVVTTGSGLAVIVDTRPKLAEVVATGTGLAEKAGD